MQTSSRILPKESKHSQTNRRKKVEVWHSVLRTNTQKFDDAKSIEDTAKPIASSGFINDFVQSFVPQYHRGHAKPNLWLIVVKTAQFLLDFRHVTSDSLSGLLSHDSHRKERGEMQHMSNRLVFNWIK